MKFLTPFERYAAADGLRKGLAYGYEDGIRRALRAFLKGKFKEEGAALAAAVSKKDAAWVESAIERLAEADSLDEARKALGLDP
jgi:hypothetical protein